MSRVRLGIVGYGLVVLVSACAPKAQPGPPEAGQIPGLEAALEGRSGDPELWTRLAGAYRAAGDLQEARSLLERVLRGNPGHPGAVLLLAVVSEELGLYPESRALFRHFLELGASGEVRRQVSRRLRATEHLAQRSLMRSALAGEVERGQRPPNAGLLVVFPPFAVRDSGLSLALADLLARDVAGSTGLRPAERGSVVALMSELQARGGGGPDEALARRGGRVLGAGQVVQLGLEVAGGEARLSATVIRPGSGADERRARVSVTGASSRPSELGRRLALQLLDALGAAADTLAVRRLVETPAVAPAAVEAYGRGLAALDAGAFEAAARQFGQAASADRGFRPAVEQQRLASALGEAARTTSAMVVASFWRLGPGRLMGDARAADVLVDALAPAGMLSVRPESPTPAGVLTRNTAQGAAGEGLRVGAQTVEIVVTRPRPTPSTGKRP